jgi:collagenase-like PrtC family protease
MKMSVPCTWEDSLIEGLKKMNDTESHVKVTEIFGSLKSSFIGSGHSAASIRGTCLNKKDVETFVEKIHREGFEFNYTLNSSCLGNREFDYNDRKKIIKEIEWIASFSNSITVSIPLLIELVKNICGSEIEIVASVIAGIDSLKKVKHFQELGANRIVLDISLNRNPVLIKEIRKKSNVLLELLVNDSCLLECPYRNYHYNIGSHGSQKGNLFYLDYCIYKCLLKRLESPEEILKSPWIRPEDLKHYVEDIDYIKLGGREKNSEWVLRASDAYLKGKYEGNILDLLTIVTPESHELGSTFLGEAPKFLLDNKNLETYMEPFLKGKRKCSDCETCGYCLDYTEKNLIYDKEHLEEYSKRFKKIGKLFFEIKSGNLIVFNGIKFVFLNFVKDTFLWKKAKPILNKQITKYISKRW